MFRFWSTRYVTHLETEIAWYRDQLAHERRRAEEAYNGLLAAARAPVAMSTYSHAEARAAQTPSADALLRDAEFAMSGALPDFGSDPR